MDSNTNKTVEINLKDLFFVLLRKIGIIAIIGFIFAGTLFGYKYATSANDTSVLDISSKLDGESDVDYEARVLDISRAEDIINSIDALNSQIENQRQYVSDSILMQIDAENEAVTTANLVIKVNDTTMSGTDEVLISSYSQDILSGDYLAELAEEWGTKQGYLAELISVEYKSTTTVVVSTEDMPGTVATFMITVVGPSTDYTDKIMDMILAEVDVKAVELNETTVPHSITVSGRKSFYMVDNNTRDLQYTAINRFELIQKQIETYDKALDDIASEIGVYNKSSLYAYFSFNEDMQKSSALGAAIKFAELGFVVGALLVVFFLVLQYVFGKRFATQAKLFGRFSCLNRIGVVKPENKRSRFVKAIDVKTGDDSILSDEDSNMLLAANINNLTFGMKKVLFTGTAETEKIRKLVSKLDIKADVKASFFADPACLASVNEYDGIIIVEQRNHSECSKVAEELTLIANTNTTLIGAIVI